MNRKIIYYVASSLDGFIAGPNENISGFVPEGPGVDQYLEDLKEFDTVIMGRKTYEFGYQFGLKPGMPAYPHMQHYIFSSSLQLEQAHPKVQVRPVDLPFIQALKAETGTPIYLCGGGAFAGYLLENELIDELKIKLNPLILGDGIRLFGESKKSYQLQLIESQQFADGLLINSYDLIY